MKHIHTSAVPLELICYLHPTPALKRWAIATPSRWDENHPSHQEKTFENRSNETLPTVPPHRVEWARTHGNRGHTKRRNAERCNERKVMTIHGLHFFVAIFGQVNMLKPSP